MLTVPPSKKGKHYITSPAETFAVQIAKCMAQHNRLTSRFQAPPNGYGLDMTSRSLRAEIQERGH
jgi:hypothetical protein